VPEIMVQDIDLRKESYLHKRYGDSILCGTFPGNKYYFFSYHLVFE
jgi:hypothetical protein